MSSLQVLQSGSEISSPRLGRLYDYWLGLKGNRVGPKREQIEPATIRGDLPFVWLVEVLDGGEDFYFRLAGSELKSFMGHDNAGKRLSERPQTPYFKNVRRVFSACVSERLPILVGPVRTSFPERSHLAITVLTMPLSENGRDVSMLFGGFESTLVALPQTETVLGS